MEQDFEISLRANEECYTLITYKEGLITFNREKSGHSIEGNKLDGNCNVRSCDVRGEEKLEIQIFSDTSSIEIFINNKYCMSNTIYPFGKAEKIYFKSNKGCLADLAFSPFNLKNGV